MSDNTKNIGDPVPDVQALDIEVVPVVWNITPPSGTTVTTHFGPLTVHTNWANMNANVTMTHVGPPPPTPEELNPPMPPPVVYVYNGGSSSGSSGSSSSSSG